MSSLMNGIQRSTLVKDPESHTGEGSHTRSSFFKPKMGSTPEKPGFNTGFFFWGGGGGGEEFRKEGRADTCDFDHTQFC